MIPTDRNWYLFILKTPDEHHRAFSFQPQARPLEIINCHGFLLFLEGASGLQDARVKTHFSGSRLFAEPAHLVAVIPIGRWIVYSFYLMSRLIERWTVLQPSVCAIWQGPVVSPPQIFWTLLPHFQSAGFPAWKSMIFLKKEPLARLRYGEPLLQGKVSNIGNSDLLWPKGGNLFRTGF